MEQYLNLVWKNLTASISADSDEPFSDDETFANNDLHYKIPFWIGSIVIGLLILTAIIASIRYCYYTLCASVTETEKLALVPPKSPAVSVRTAHTFPRPRRPQHELNHHHSTDETDVSSSSPEQLRNLNSAISIIPIGHQSTRSYLASVRSNRTDVHDDNEDNHYFSPTQIIRSRAPIDFRKKVHGVYVLPVSPALSSSSSTTTNTDESIKLGSSTMPIRSRRQFSSSMNRHNHGIKNQSFAESPQLTNRTLPRSQATTLRRTPAPSQPPPSPPSPMHFNQVHKFTDSSTNNGEKLNLDVTKLDSRIGHENSYDLTQEIQIKKPPPPPVPCRTQKPTVLPIGFQQMVNQVENIGFQTMLESSTHEDFTDHSWPKPPESLTTSQISTSAQAVPSSISYDRLQHDHLLPTVVLRQQKTVLPHCFHLSGYDQDKIPNESDS